MTRRLIIAGGGLSGVLTAMAVVRRHPDADLLLVEAGPALGGNHTWSFYESDLDDREQALVAPFVAHRWDGYETHFAGFSRTFSTGYRTLTSAELHRVALAVLGSRVRLGAPVMTVEAAAVTLSTGERLAAEAVIDARGAAPLCGARLAWQTFLGREVRLHEPHGLTRPTIMDARVAQDDGFRFMYLLPFGSDTLLIEDTSYSVCEAVAAEVLRARIGAYAAARGWRIAAVIREETGALPLLLAGDFATLWAAAAPPGGAAPVGLRAGLFHPVTGYSLPFAVRAALALAALPGPPTTARLRTAVERFAREHFARTAFERALNRLLFLAAAPAERHRVLARFHRLPQGVVERFYAGRSTRLDRARILSGKPPVPLAAAFRALRESGPARG